MAGVALVLCGFLFGVLHDLASLRRTPFVKPWLLGLAVSAHLAGAWQLIARSERYVVPRSVRRLSLVASIGGLMGMVYSIAIEIPFRSAWIDRGHTSTLVTRGTYSVSRHPGVLWTSIWVPAVALASGSRDLLRWWPVVIAADVVHVAIQDRWLLPRVFGEEYRDYQRRVPFLLPRRRDHR